MGEDLNKLRGGDPEAFRAELPEMVDDINFLRPPPSATCYGPTLGFSGHVDSGTPDGNTTDDGPEDDDGQLPGGDLGLWQATEPSTGEACCVAKFNSIIGEVQQYINAGTHTATAAMGAAAMDESLREPPAKGETNDLAPKVNEEYDAAGVPIDVTVATLMREANDTAAGDPIFETLLNQTAALPIAGGGSRSVSIETILEHVPMGGTADAPTNDTNCGQLIQAVNILAADRPEGLGNCGGANGITRCMRIDYCKDSETTMSFLFQTAEFCGLDKDCGNVDPSDKVGPGNTDGWGNNFYKTVCNVTDTGGKCTQAWQAGPMDNNTRVLNVEVSDTGKCFFGYGPDVAAASGVGSIDRMICNWAGPGNNHTGQSLAQRQTLVKNSSGLWVPETNNITYAPTNSCSKPAGNMTYQIPGDPASMVAGGTAVTHNLISLPVDFTQPTPPDLPAEIE